MVTVKIVKTEVGKNFDAALKSLNEKVAKVGWFEKSKYPDGMQVATVAAIQEQGYPSKHIPARPFMRPTIERERNNWKLLISKLAQGVLIGKLNTTDLMETLGQKAAGDVKKTISEIFSPALAESTILARIRKNATLSKKKKPLSVKSIGNIHKPLIDTGLMFATLINSVEDKE